MSETDQSHVIRSVYKCADPASGQELLEALFRAVSALPGTRSDAFSSLDVDGLVQLYQIFPSGAGAERFGDAPEIAELLGARGTRAGLQPSGDAGQRIACANRD